MDVEVIGIEVTFSVAIITTDQHENEAQAVWDKMVKGFQADIENYQRKQIMLTAERLSAKMIGG